MPNIEELNVKIKADASSLKKETEASIKVLDELQKRIDSLNKQMMISLKGRDIQNGGNEKLGQLNEQKINLEGLKQKYNSGNITADEIEKALEDLDIKNALDEVRSALRKAFKEDSDYQKISDAITNSVEDISSSFNVGKMNNSELSAYSDNLREAIASVKSKLSQKEEEQEKDPTNTEINNNVKEIKMYLGRLQGYLATAMAQQDRNNAGEKAKEVKDKGKDSAVSIIKGLVGIRSLFTFVRKIAQQNEALVQSLSTFTGTIGNALKPVLDLLASVINSLTGWIAKLFGVNVSTAKSTAETAKNTASFDEINNIDNSSSGGGEVSVPSFKTALSNAWEGLKEFRENLGEVAGWLDLIAITLGTIAGIKAFDKIKTSLLEFFTTLKTKGDETLGWLGFASWGELAAYGGIAALFIGYAKYYDENKAAIDAWSKSADDSINAAIKGIGEKLEQGKADFDSWAVKADESLTNTVKSAADKFNEWKDSYKKWAKDADQSITNFIVSAKNGLSTKAIEIVNSITNAWTNLKNSTINAFTNMKSSLQNIWSGIWTTIRGFLNKIIGGVESMVNSCIRGINSMTRGLRNLGNSVLKALGISGFSFSELSTISLPRLATGTNYVPQDMVAMLHAGEAVVPKKYNPNAGGLGTEEVLGRLDALIDIIGTKEFKAYISNKEVGKAAVSYINQQSRILGGALV